MAEHIYPKTIRGNTYYYYQRTWREKIDPSNSGKTRGSGKSRVRTESHYLGTARVILEKVKGGQEPTEIYHRDFGFVCAVYNTAKEVGLVDLLRQYIPGARYGIPRWIFFLLPIINRLQHATSKEQMGAWAAKTVLPQILGFDPKKLNSKTFWYVTDDLLCESDLKKVREESPDLKNDLFAGIDDTIFRMIEERLFQRVQTLFQLSSDVLFYDTTNFFTYIEDPVRSLLARTGNNKDSHHHLKQVGLALCVEKEWGIPFFHRLYRGNSHDSKTFTVMVEDLLTQVQESFDRVDELVLVLDKGNNSEENFEALQDRIQWVGSLVPTHYPDLLDLPLEAYEGSWGETRFYRHERDVMGIPCVLVLTYSPTLARRQEHRLQQGLWKLKKKILEKWTAYKRTPKKVPKGILSMLEKERYGRFLTVSVEHGELSFHTDCTAIEDRRKRFGKNLLFSNSLRAETGWIITQYRSKETVEGDFKLLKDPELIRWRPSRHWTDTKIRAFGFCCVMALVLIKIMQLKAMRAGLSMSPAVLKAELSDLRQVLMLYDPTTVKSKISSRSTIQQKLWNLFDLETSQKELEIH